MKTIEERAKAIVELLIYIPRENRHYVIESALKQQDKITRHSCAEEAITVATEDIYKDSEELADKIHAAIINKKTV
jgi:hypothetical protein